MTGEPPSYPPPPGGYGYQPPPSGGYGYQPPPQAAGTNGMAIASLVSSLAGLLVGWLILCVPSILGLIFGFVALGQIKKTGQGGRGMAIAGIAIGAFVTVFMIVGVIIYLATRPHTSHTNSGAPAVVVVVEQQAVSPIVAA